MLKRITLTMETKLNTQPLIKTRVISNSHLFAYKTTFCHLHILNRGVIYMQKSIWFSHMKL